MEDLFLKVLETTLSCSIIIILALILSAILGKRFTAGWRYWIWMILAVRLIIPISLTLPQAPLHIAAPARQVVIAMPHTDPQEQRLADPAAASDGLATADPAVSAEVSPIPPGTWQSSGDIPPENAPFRVSVLDVLAILWASGAILYLGWQVFAYCRFAAVSFAITVPRELPF